jgi:hypothetical protein
MQQIYIFFTNLIKRNTKIYDDGFVDSRNFKSLEITIFLGLKVSDSFSILSIKSATACLPIVNPCCAIVVIDGDEY